MNSNIFQKTTNLSLLPKLFMNNFLEWISRSWNKSKKGWKLNKDQLQINVVKDFMSKQWDTYIIQKLPKNKFKKTGKTRAGAHSDFGTLTLLLQKPGFGQGGLLALNT